MQLNAAQIDEIFGRIVKPRHGDDYLKPLWDAKRHELMIAYAAASMQVGSTDYTLGTSQDTVETLLHDLTDDVNCLVGDGFVHLGQPSIRVKMIFDTKRTDQRERLVDFKPKSPDPSDVADAIINGLYKIAKMPPESRPKTVREALRLDV